MTDKETIEEIKKLITESGQGQVILFINCTIENMTITNFEKGEHQHYYQKAPGQIVTQGHKEGE